MTNDFNNKKKMVVHNKKEPFDVYIGRPGPWGNPFSHLGKEASTAEFKTDTREEAIAKYGEWIQTQPELLGKIWTLKNKVLGCWCSPKPCHGDILAALAEKAVVPEDIFLLDDSGNTEGITSFTDDFRFLSNFYPAVIYHDGISYPTVEHFYQAMKTLDVGERKRIAKLRTPYDAKKASKDLEIRPGWDSIRDGFMEEGLRQKFKSGTLLAQMLLATEDVLLQEGNHWGDTYWGIDVRTGYGHNRLGKLLMKIRKELRSELSQ